MVELSDGISVIQLSGLRVRELLCTLVPVDVDPSVLEVNGVATTMIAGVRITQWRVNDLPDGASVFEFGVPSSYCEDLLRVLVHTVGDARAEARF